MIVNRTPLFVITLFLGMATPTVRADLINVPTIGTVNMTANTDSAVQTIALNDLNPGVPTNMIGWGLGFHIVPLSGATGTVTIIQSSIAYPTTNHIFGAPFSPAPSAAPAIGTDSPGFGDFSASASENGANSVLVPGGAGKNMMTLQFHASAGAGGNFALQLVDSGTILNPQNSYWVDDVGPDSHYFSVGGAAFFSGIQLGTISLPPAAVPEPGSLVLCSAALGFAGWRARRRAKQAAAVVVAA